MTARYFNKFEALQVSGPVIVVTVWAIWCGNQPSAHHFSTSHHSLKFLPTRTCSSLFKWLLDNWARNLAIHLSRYVYSLQYFGYNALKSIQIPKNQVFACIFFCIYVNASLRNHFQTEKQLTPSKRYIFQWFFQTRLKFIAVVVRPFPAIPY